jgi:hypothetical protein
MSANKRAAGNQGIYPRNKCGVVGHPSQRNCGSPSKIGKKQKDKITLTRLQVVLILNLKTYCADKNRITDCTILIVTE